MSLLVCFLITLPAASSPRHQTRQPLSQTTPWPLGQLFSTIPWCVRRLHLRFSRTSAHAVITIAGSFAGAGDALRCYAISIEVWQEELHALKDLEDEVGNVIRDREILFVHTFFFFPFPHSIAFLHFLLIFGLSAMCLIKPSKNQKPTHESFIGSLGSSGGEASQISLNSFTSPGRSSSKLGAAQSELQVCEAHLAMKEKELDELRVSAVRRCLDARCKAMVGRGWKCGEMGEEGLRAISVSLLSPSGSHAITDGVADDAGPVFSPRAQHHASRIRRSDRRDDGHRSFCYGQLRSHAIPCMVLSRQLLAQTTGLARRCGPVAR